MTSTIGTARANPTKGFFVQMLTRDISLEDCILDLIDNSIDGAWAESGENPIHILEDKALSAYRIDLEIGTDRFVIQDNCGGLTQEIAEKYAFTFGREGTIDVDQLDMESEAADYVVDSGDDAADADGVFSVGVYGIGMKRAIFKMGRSIAIRSTYEDDGKQKSFVVPIDVRSWVLSSDDSDKERPDSWSFPIEESQPLDANGVRIEVTSLTPSVKRRVSSPSFINALRRIVGRDYMIPLMRGLTITINGEEVVSTSLKFASGDEFDAMRQEYDSNGVTVEIIAGMSMAPPTGNDPTEDKQQDPWGWFVVCNGRVILAADKTETTGWGTSNLQKWHPQYNGFVGVVLFSSDDPLKLPMTTTKRSVDVSSRVFQGSLGRMAKASKAWIKYTNERKSNLSTAIAKEKQVASLPLSQVPSRTTVGLPQLAASERQANVGYAVDPVRMRELAIALGDVNKSYREVGLESFDYTFAHLVSDN